MADGDIASSSGTRRIASVPQNDAPIATSKTPTKPPRFQAISLSSSRPAELGDDALPVGSDELLLVAPDVVDVDLVEAQVHVVLEVLQVLVQVGGGEDAVLEVLDGDLLRHRREVLRVADVCLGERHPAVGPLLHRLLLGRLLVFGPGDVKLDHARHGRGVLVLLARPLLELLHEHPYLLVRRPDGDDPIAVPARPLALDRTRGRYVDGRRRLGHGVEPRALQLYVLPRVFGHLAAEEPPDHFERRRGLGDYGRVVAEPRRRHPGAEAHTRSSPQSAEPGPYEGALALLGCPGVEVIRGHDRGEAALLSDLAPSEKVSGVELLEHRRVPHRARELAPSLHGRLPWLREDH